jgi:hypothetical protein
MWAYYHEFARGSVAEQTLLENLCININCGSFSYAEIAHEFNFIIGVTGTLKSLSAPEKQII